MCRDSNLKERKLFRVECKHTIRTNEWGNWVEGKAVHKHKEMACEPIKRLYKNIEIQLKLTEIFIYKTHATILSMQQVLVVCIFDAIILKCIYTIGRMNGVYCQTNNVKITFF